MKALLLLFALSAHAAAPEFSGAAMKAWYKMLGDLVLPGGDPMECESDMLNQCRQSAEQDALDHCGQASCAVDHARTRVVVNGQITVEAARRFPFEEDVYRQIINKNDRTTRGCICSAVARQ